MPFYRRADVRIRYEEYGAGFPLLVPPDETPAHPYQASVDAPIKAAAD